MYYRKPNQELLQTANGSSYTGYVYYAGDKQSPDDVEISDPPSTDKRWYFLANGEWAIDPQAVTFEELVLSGKISLQSAKEQLIEKVKEIAYTKTSIAFESQALGETHRYESAFIDQFNLLCNVVKVMIDDQPVEHRCVRISDKKDDFFIHSPAQMKTVFAEGVSIHSRSS